MTRKLEFRLCSGAAVRAAAAEAETLCRGGEAEGLCRNACLLARVVYRGRRRMFRNGAAVLRRLPAEAIACWTAAYADLCRSQDWPARLEALRQDRQSRLKWKVLRAFGVLPTEDRADLSPEGLRDCLLNMMLDREEQLAALCPQCREALTEDRCPVCGAVQFGENPYFDRTRFEELKQHGSSDLGSDA